MSAGWRRYAQLARAWILVRHGRVVPDRRAESAGESWSPLPRGLPSARRQGMEGYFASRASRRLDNSHEEASRLGTIAGGRVMTTRVNLDAPAPAPDLVESIRAAVTGARER